MLIRDVVVKAGAYAMLSTLAIGASSFGPAGVSAVLLSAKASSTSAVTVKVAAMVFGGMAVRYGPDIAFTACEKLSGLMYDGALEQASKATRFVADHMPFKKPSVKESPLPANIPDLTPSAAAQAA